tara:strand:+ start:859 stop:1050 length:192 start_codon:yes stop_codon:yes gene_type:complete
VVKKVVSLIEKGVSILIHLVVLIFGGIIRVGSLKRPKTIMLINHLIIMCYVFYRIYFYINYGR